MIVAPHADDEVLGCGGMMAKYPDECQVAVVTWSGRTRWSEHEKAMDVLGVASLGHLSVPDGEAWRDPLALTRMFDRLFADIRPGAVYLPYPGAHQDHVAVYEAGMRACRQSLTPLHWMPPSVLVYETPVYDLDTHDWPLRYSVFEVLDDDQMMLKAKAMECYESQHLKPHAGSPDELVARARSLGLARGVDYAEQFAAVRLVW